MFAFEQNEEPLAATHIVSISGKLKLLELPPPMYHNVWKSFAQAMPCIVWTVSVKYRVSSCLLHLVPSADWLGADSSFMWQLHQGEWAHPVKGAPVAPPPLHPMYLHWTSPGATPQGHALLGLALARSLQHGYWGTVSHVVEMLVPVWSTEAVVFLARPGASSVPCTSTGHPRGSAVCHEEWSPPAQIHCYLGRTLFTPRSASPCPR